LTIHIKPHIFELRSAVTNRPTWLTPYTMPAVPYASLLDHHRPAARKMSTASPEPMVHSLKDRGLNRSACSPDWSRKSYNLMGLSELEPGLSRVSVHADARATFNESLYIRQATIQEQKWKVSEQYQTPGPDECRLAINFPRSPSSRRCVRPAAIFCLTSRLSRDGLVPAYVHKPFFFPPLHTAGYLRDIIGVVGQLHSSGGPSRSRRSPKRMIRLPCLLAFQVAC
ncbi:hypothetical protein KCU85_g56, partial [Aureobasidium melanogenum]